MLKGFVKGFEEMMDCIKAAFHESMNDEYAGWDEWRELEMLNEVRAGIR